MKAFVVLTTLPSAAAAGKMARLLVRRKLAACVSVQRNIKSYYVWKGKLTASNECLLLIKTKSSHYLKVERFIKEHHPYDLPEILALPVAEASKKYLEWLGSSV